MNDAAQESGGAPEVSVVVPVHNKAPFVAACLESILAQTLTSLELICVDDASTDGSSEIIDRFAADERVRVIRQDRNRGAAVARNVGLDAARGEFVQFVDADDLLPPDALRLLSLAARTDGVEIVRGGIVGFRSSAPEAERVLDMPRARSGFRPLDDESTWVPWWHTTYLLSRRLLTSDGLRYPDLCSGEDPVFLAQVLTRASAMSAIAAVVYRHRLAPLAQKGRTTYRHLRDYLKHAELTRDIFVRSKPDAWYRGFAPLLLPELRSMISDWRMSDAERAAAMSEMRRIFEPPSPRGTEPQAKVLFLYNVCGLGGVETSIVNKIKALSARGIEARAVFQSLWGEGGRLLLQQPGFAIAADEEAQARSIGEFGPDIIVVIDWPKFLNMINKSGARCPVVFETHMSDTEAFKRRRIFDAVCNARVSKVVVPSVFNRDALIVRGVDPQRVSVIPNAIDAEAFRTTDSGGRNGFGLPDGRRLVLFVGRLEPQKNPIEFLRVCGALLEQGADIHAVVVGDAVNSAELTKALYIEAEALRGNISFIPRVAYDEMPSLYAAVANSGGCLLSTSLHESQPMIFLEAMTCGCPVVTSDVGGVRELVADGITGQLYALGDVAHAAAATLRLLNDGERRASVVEAAVRHVQSRHSSAATAAAYLALFDELGVGGGSWS